jgi:hypothetical protein
MHAYAYGTPEARELVNELEFVWDQVKSNAQFNTAASNHSSNNSRQAGIDEIISGDKDVRTKEGLRVLRPMSDQDEEEAAAEAAEEVDAERNEAGRGRSDTWQGRVDRALVQMTAEIAALREVVEARGRTIWGRRSGGSASEWGWVGWIFSRIWSLVKRAIFDAVIILLLYIIVRWKKGGKDIILKAWETLKIQFLRRVFRRLKSQKVAGVEAG